MSSERASSEVIAASFELERVCGQLNLSSREVYVGSLDRYVLHRRLGQGGMGEVYLAHDRTLDREVALKVITTKGLDTDRLRSQLMREARALARVHHPNVLPIHDVEASEAGALFLTTRYITGSTLRAWQSDRRLHEVLQAYVQAGRGLEAAHQCGVVHRDFKPSNVLVGAHESEVFVADFGLAVASSQRSTLASGGLAEGGEGSAASTSRQLQGTSAYFAPELLGGHAASFSSDQYAYCVALWEAVTGSLPQPDADGRSQRPQAMPPWLYRVLARGLATDPGARFSKMGELLVRLDGGLSRPKRFAIAAGVVAVAITFTGMLALDSSTNQAPSCEAKGRPVDQVWTDEARVQVTRALDVTTAEGRRDLDFALAVLDESAAAWRVASVGSCERHRVDPLSLRAVSERGCLEERLVAITDTIRAVARTDEGLEPDLLAMLEDLTRVGARCQLPRPRLAESARGWLDEAVRAENLREYEEAITYANKVVTSGPDLGESCLETEPYRVESGEARFRIAHILGNQDRPSDALAELAAAAAEADACAHDELRARIHVQRAQVLAIDLERPVEAQGELGQALAIYARLGSLGWQASEIHKTRAFVALSRGAFGEAVSCYEQAIAALGDERGVAPTKAKLYINIGAALQDAGDFAAAERAYLKGVEVVSSALSPAHPETRARRARASLNRGLMALERGDDGRAQALLAEVLELDDPSLEVKARGALVQIASGDEARFDEASVEALALLAALERLDDMPARTRAEGLTIAGQQLVAAGDPRGLISLDRALALWDALPSEPEIHDICQLSYAQALASVAREDEAAAQLLSLFARFGPDTNPQVRAVAATLGRELGLVELMASASSE